MIKNTINGTDIGADWCGGIAEGSVVLTGINEKAAAKGTLDKLKEVKEKIKNGEIKVFDTNTFTKDGKKLDSYMADVNTDEAFTPDTEVIKDGYFHESEFRAAPYFDIQIDGIKLLNTNFG
jgi:basic membrane protein A